MTSLRYPTQNQIADTLRRAVSDADFAKGEALKPGTVAISPETHEALMDAYARGEQFEVRSAGWKLQEQLRGVMPMCLMGAGEPASGPESESYRGYLGALSAAQAAEAKLEAGQAIKPDEGRTVLPDRSIIGPGCPSVRSNERFDDGQSLVQTRLVGDQLTIEAEENDVAFSGLHRELGEWLKSADKSKVESDGVYLYNAKFITSRVLDEVIAGFDEANLDMSRDAGLYRRVRASERHEPLYPVGYPV